MLPRPPDDGAETDMNTIVDDRLGFMFACCHPALGVEARIALTLRTLAGLTTEEIADAFLAAQATMAQRLVRVKRKIRDAAIPFDVPPPERLAERLDDVCTVIYLIFNEGYAATSGERLVRTELCTEAIRLARVLAPRCRTSRRCMGLLALLLFHDSRRAARTTPAAASSRSRPGPLGVGPRAIGEANDVLARATRSAAPAPISWKPRSRRCTRTRRRPRTSTGRHRRALR